MMINSDKSIGKVLFIVEGGKTEFNLLRKIFCDIFSYDYIEKPRQKQKFKVFEKGDFKKSRVAVLNTKESNISFVEEDGGYLEVLFEKLISEHGFSFDNARIYYLFDRDPKSNLNIELISGLIQKLKNAQENDDGMSRGGLILLSYPCIESYILSGFIKDSHKLKFGLGNELKHYLDSVQEARTQNITEDIVKAACEELMKYFESEGISFNIDDIGVANLEVFQKQENEYDLMKEYRLLSLLSIALIDLGIITL